MKRQVLALIGAAALGASLLGTLPAQAAQPRVAPGVPVNVEAGPGDLGGDIRVDWEPAPGDNAITTSYKVRYHFTGQQGAWLDGGTVDGIITETVISNLDAKASYVFQVNAINDEGESGWSADSNAASPRQYLPGAPSNVTPTPGDGVVTLSWTAPTPQPDAYEVQYIEDRPGASWKPSDPIGPLSSTSVRITNLYADQKYFFRVRSTNGDALVSDWVTTTTSVSPLTTPGPVLGLVADAGDARVVLDWTAPFPAPDGYQVQYRTSSSSAWQTTATTTQTEYTATGLTNGTSYVFQVSSTRGSLVSTPVQVTATPSGTWVTPAPPTSVSAVPGNTLAYMSWTIAAGTPLTGFDVQYSTNNSSWFPTNGLRTGSTNLNYVLSGLSNGVAYYLRVRVVNGPQVSTWTQMPGTVIPLGVPGPPTGVSGTPGNGQVLVAWTPPATPSIPVTGYLVQVSTNGGVTWTNAVTLNTPTTSVVVGGLTNGVAYVFRVAATSSVGTGAWSNPSAPIVPPGGPGAPTNVIGAPGNGAVAVGWNAPAGTQPSPITGYRVTASPGGQSCFTNANPPTAPATTCNVTGLTNGQAYTFTVVTITAIGVSTPSAPSAPVTPVGGPNPPTGVTAVAGDRSATVNWVPPVNTSGGPITSYRATSSPDGRSCTVSAPATTCTVTGLTNGQAYTFTVVAISSIGTSISSSPSAPVTPFTTEVTIRITDSSRDGRKIIIKGTTQGMDPGDTLDVLIRNSGKGKFNPAGEVTIKSNGTFRWTSTNVNKTWVRVTDGDVVSNTVIIPAR